MFPEGTRIRPARWLRQSAASAGSPWRPGAPVVPVAIIGTEDVRKGWRIRPRKVRIRAGRALRFPQRRAGLTIAGRRGDRPHLAVRDAPVGVARRAAADSARRRDRRRHRGYEPGGVRSPGPDSRSTSAAARAEQAAAVARSRSNDRYLPGVELPDPIRIRSAAELELERHDLVCLAVPARALPAVLAAHGGADPQRARRVLVLSKGLVPPLGTLPSAFVAERSRARAVAVLGGPAHAADVLDARRLDRAGLARPRVRRQLAETLRARRPGRDRHQRRDRRRTRRRRQATSPCWPPRAARGAGPNVGRGCRTARCSPRSTRWRGARRATGDVRGAGRRRRSRGAVVAASRNRRAGELLARACPGGHRRRSARPLSGRLGPLLATRRASTPSTPPRSRAWRRWSRDGSTADQWTAGVTDPTTPPTLVDLSRGIGGCTLPSVPDDPPQEQGRSRRPLH